MSKIRVLGLSNLFPSAAMPRHGIFLQHRLAHLNALDDVDVRMVAPVPWFPFAHPRFGQYAAFARVPREETRAGIATLYPRHLVIPKFGMALTPALMARALLPLLRRIRAGGFDFDVIDSYYMFPDGVAAMALGAALDRPVLMTAFGTDVNLVPRFAGPRRQLVRAANQAAGITAVCQALADELLRIGVLGERLRVVLHGVDLELFRPPADRAGLRARLGFDGPTLLAVGHMIPRKGFHLAIEALARLEGTRLVIAGDGPQQGELRALADRFGVADRVRMLGHVEQSRLPELFGAADALLLASDREGIANVLMEAMACGTPVAATPIWGSPEIVCVPEAGLLLTERSVDAIVDGVRTLLAAPPDRGATRRYAERFSWAETARQHRALIGEVLGR